MAIRKGMIGVHSLSEQSQKKRQGLVLPGFRVLGLQALGFWGVGF